MYNITVGDLECLHDHDHGLPLTDGLLLILGLIFEANCIHPSTVICFTHTKNY